MLTLYKNVQYIYGGIIDQFHNTPYAAHVFISGSVVGSVLVIISTFSYWGITWWGTVSVSGLTGDGTVPTMDNTIYKLFPLLVLPCLSDLVCLIQHIIICTNTVHTSIRTDTPTRLIIQLYITIIL